MTDPEQLATFFGWCTVINVGIYLVTVIAFLLLKGLILRLNARAFSITETGQ